MAVPNPWWKRWICYLSCEWFTKPLFGKRLCVCAYDAIGYKKKVKRQYKGKDGGWRFFQLPKTIAFMGLDGSGKTTHSNAVKAFLTSHQIPYTSIHLPSAHPLRFVPKSRRTQLTEASCTREKHGFFICVARQKFLFFGMAWIYLTSIMPSLLRGRVVICDRWFYDELIHLRYRKMCHLPSFIENLIPRPGMLFYLNLPAETAHQRSKEADLSYFLTKKKMYDSLAQRKKAMVIEVGTKEATAKAIEDRLRQRFGHTLWE